MLEKVFCRAPFDRSAGWTSEVRYLPPPYGVIQFLVDSSLCYRLTPVVANTVDFAGLIYHKSFLLLDSTFYSLIDRKASVQFS